MIYFLFFYFIFLIAYIAFNIYAAFKIWSMRLNHDATQLVLTSYLIIIGTIIVISLIIISGLNWPGFSKQGV